MEGCLTISNFFPVMQDVLEFSFSFGKSQSFPRISGIDSPTFIMYGFLCSLKFSSDLIISKAAKSFGERSSGTYIKLMNDNSTG